MTRFSLRQRTIFFTALTILIVIALLTFATYQILLGSFIQLEQDEAHKNIARLQHVLNYQIEELHTIGADWAYWDATYDFVRSGDPAYIEENLSDQSFITLGNSLLILLDTDGEVIFAKHFDEEEGGFVEEVPSAILPYIEAGQPLVSHADNSSFVEGILMLDGKPLIVSSFPILTSEQRGPRRGTLIWGRTIGEAAIADLAEMTELPVELYSVDPEGAPPEVSDSIRLMLSAGQSEYISELDSMDLALYSVGYDVNGDPALVLRSVMQRRILQQGWITFTYVLGAVLIVALLIGGVSAFQLERTVLARLDRLNLSVKQVTSPSERIKADGHDELGELAASINGMLKALEESDRALRESEDRYRRLVEFSPEALSVYVDGRIVYANQAAARLLGASSPLDLLGRHMLDFIHTDFDKLEKERMRRLISFKEEQPLMGQKYVRLDGTIIDVEVVAIPITYYGRAAAQIIAMDVTERKRAEEALRDAHEQLQATLDALPDLMFILDAEGRHYDYRAARDSMLHAPPSEFLAKTVREVLPEPTADLIMKAIDEALHHGLSSGTIYDLNTPEGHRWFELSVALRGSAERENVRLVALARDITARKNAQDAEREQRALFEALGATAAVLGSTLDIDQIYSHILSSVSRLVPHDAANIMMVENGEARIVRWHKNTHEAPVNLESFYFKVADVASFRQMIAQRRALVIQDVRQYPEWVFTDETDWIRSCIAAPICIDDEMIGCINLDSATPDFYDETHAERLQALSSQAALALRNARLYRESVEQAEALAERNRELDAFSYTVAHDLKSPLQVIIGYADLLRTDYQAEISPDVMNHIRTVESFAYRMSQMIESLLMLSTLRSAEQAIQPVEMQPIVEAAVQRLVHKISERGVRIDLPDHYPSVMGFGPWLEEIFANFIENAIKYMSDDNPNPFVRIRAVEVGSKIRYEVCDNGAGIKPEDRPKLWEMFTRFHVGKSSGSGLGLSIVRRIITKLNGEVGADSTVGEGSTFWFTLPAAPDAPADES